MLGIFCIFVCQFDMFRLLREGIWQREIKQRVVREFTIWKQFFFSTWRRDCLAQFLKTPRYAAAPRNAWNYHYMCSMFAKKSTLPKHSEICPFAKHVEFVGKCVIL